MSGVTFTITAQEQRRFQRQLAAFTRGQEVKVKKSMNRARLEMESVGKIQSEPRDTGTLRSEIRTTTIDNGYGARMTSPTEYAEYVDGGTTRIPARNYMAKGQAAGVRKFIKLMK